MIEAHAEFVDGRGRKGVGDIQRGALGIFIADAGAGVSAIGQSRQRRRANIGSSAHGIAQEELIALRGV